MTTILDLPPETLEYILSICDPCDVSAAAQTCRNIRALVYSPRDNHLWRALYLALPLDDPRTCVDQTGRTLSEEVDWKTQLQAFIRARAALSNPECLREGELVTLLRTVLNLVTNVRPMSLGGEEDGISRNLIWTAAYLRKRESDFLDCTLSPNLDEASEEVQLKSRLHTYFGMTHEDVKLSTRAASRAYVYTMRKYTEANLYGPYIANGSRQVNWVHVQAIHHVVSSHIVDLEEDDEFEYAIFPMSMPHIQPISPLSDSESMVDWAGVEGNWICSFCFCDHRDLLDYNQMTLNAQQVATGPLDPSYFQSPLFREVYRSMKVKMNVTEIRPSNGPRPVIHFKGNMGDPSAALMIGWVEMTEHDYIRWHFVSGEPGNSIWSSEGIQVGGVRSLYGVLGTWTTTFHDIDDPIGPFWLRRLVE